MAGQVEQVEVKTSIVFAYSEKNFLILLSEGIWELHTLFLPDAGGTLKYSFNQHLTSVDLRA